MHPLGCAILSSFFLSWVLQVVKCGSQFFRAEIVMPDMSNRRSEPRFKAGDTLTVKMLNVGSSEPFNAVCLDCSASGFSLDLPISVPCGTRVQLSWTDRRLTGEVQYCVNTGERYRAGIKV